jgi:excinuclease UvrABC ATPase subunit
MKSITIRGARTHNLKNIDISLPRDKLIVITGLSGSGKSSLAFDTIFAEGQRRYVESLSTYARQFLSVMEKPDIDHIEGLSPPWVRSLKFTITCACCSHASARRAARRMTCRWKPAPSAKWSIRSWQYPEKNA